MSSLIVDIHTHIYPPVYISLLRSRKQVPYLLDGSESPKSEVPLLNLPRLVILPSDDDPAIPPSRRGRPMDSSYSSVSEIIRFMDTHSIHTSILSLANPWLDFLSPAEGPEWARNINKELNSISESSGGRLNAFAALPLSASVSNICKEINTLGEFAHMKGVIMGTSGLGEGLDDPALDPIYQSLQDSQRLIFLHPHYGLPDSIFGSRASEAGHVLPLALGFPLETTVAFTRMFLSGTFDRFPWLKVLIAHAGATVPFLAGRINSCVEHERHYHDMNGNRIAGPRRSLQEVLATNVWLDAVAYSSTTVKAAAEMVGKDRVLFGTDHPFFPPLEPGAREWKSVRTNVQAIREAFQDDEKTVKGVLGENAANLLNLPVGSTL